MLVVSRFRYADGADSGDDGAERADRGVVAAPLAELGSCVELFAGFPGFVSGTVGRALDDPSLWILTTTWRDVGSYRRALSSYDVKAQVMPVLARAIDEPSAFEELAGDGAGGLTEPNEAKPRGTG